MSFAVILFLLMAIKCITQNHKMRLVRVFSNKVPAVGNS